MSVETSTEKARAGHERRHEPQKGCGQHRDGPGHLFGFDVQGVGPSVQVVAALAVLVPVTLSGLLLVAFVPGLWWIFTTYFWVAFPAFGLLARGVAGLSGQRIEADSARSKGEKELLGALSREGEISPVRAALETSLSVAEAEAMLDDLAKAGHLEVRARGGGIFYALWEGAHSNTPEALSAETRNRSKTAS